MIYTTRQLKIGKPAQLDFLSRQAGQVYSKTVATFWRAHRHSNHWLSSNAMQKLIRSEHLHSQTVQGIVQSFYEALRSWNALKKNDPNAKPPRRRKKNYAILFKSGAIRLKGGMLTLSAGRGNEPVRIPWKHGIPKVCEITFNGEEYVLNAVYQAKTPAGPTGSGYAGVDFSDVHMAALCTGGANTIANGKELQSKRHYSDMVRAHFQYEMGKCKKNSRRWARLDKARIRILRKINNQIKDILHKQTSAIVCIMKEEGIQTVGIGNMKNKREMAGSRASVSKMREMVGYKSEQAGLKVVYFEEANAKRTCPKCLEPGTFHGRVFRCGNCGLELNRDCVGAINIRSLSKYRGYVPVMGDMAPPVGIRYYARAPRTSAERSA